MLSKYEMKSHHIQAQCPCHKKGEPCNESSFQCTLFVCETCGGAEADLTEECCRRTIGHIESEQITLGLLDFKNGVWFGENDRVVEISNKIQKDCFKVLENTKGNL